MGKPAMDCFAFNAEKFECQGLISLFCMEEKCKFYKTEKQILKEQTKALKRNKELGIEDRMMVI